MNLDNRTEVVKRLMSLVSYIEKNAATPDMEGFRRSLVIMATDILGLHASAYLADSTEELPKEEDLQGIIDQIREKAKS